MGFSWDNLNPLGDDFLGTGSGVNRGSHAEDLYGGADPNGDMARAANYSASMGRGEYGRGLSYHQDAAALRKQGADQMAMLRRRAEGQDSLSAEQLRQGLQQVNAGQMSMAAGARPGNSAAAARQASMNAGSAGSAMLGQQAMAGIQERAAAENQLGQAIMGQRGQSIQGELGAFGAANQAQANAQQGYGNIEDSRTRRYGALMQTPTEGEQALAGLKSAGQMAAAAYSDRRLKKNIEDGDGDARDFLDGLKAYKYKYKNEKFGKGEFVGPMAQDLERSKAGRATVVETKEGKAVHGARLGLALAAAAGHMHRRLSKLEGDGED